MAEVLDVGVLLLLPDRAVDSRVFDGLAAAGFSDITRAQARVLQRIAATGCRLTDLAARAEMTKQSAGFLIDQLERTSDVERVPDPTDGRARLVRPADRGPRTVEVARRHVAEVEAEWTVPFGATRMAHLRDILADLREIPDPWHDATTASGPP